MGIRRRKVVRLNVLAPSLRYFVSPDISRLQARIEVHLIIVEIPRIIRFRDAADGTAYDRRFAFVDRQISLLVAIVNQVFKSLLKVNKKILAKSELSTHLQCRRLSLAT